MNNVVALLLHVTRIRRYQGVFRGYRYELIRNRPLETKLNRGK